MYMYPYIWHLNQTCTVDSAPTVTGSAFVRRLRLFLDQRGGNKTETSFLKVKSKIPKEPPIINFLVKNNVMFHTVPNISESPHTNLACRGWWRFFGIWLVSGTDMCTKQPEIYHCSASAPTVTGLNGLYAEIPFIIYWDSANIPWLNPVIISATAAIYSVVKLMR